MKIIVQPELGFFAGIDETFYFVDTEKLPNELREIVESQIENGNNDFNDLYDIAHAEGEEINIGELLGLTKAG